MLETLANVGEFVGALGVIVSIGYLAIQIRHNTKAVRSSSYHQAAEQTWSACLALAQSPDLAATYVRAVDGAPLGREEQVRLGGLDAGFLFGFENMQRLHEEGLVDDEVFRNVIDNSLSYLASPRVQALLRVRPGPLSAKLAAEAMRRAKALDLPPPAWQQPGGSGPSEGAPSYAEPSA